MSEPEPPPSDPDHGERDRVHAALFGGTAAIRRLGRFEIRGLLGSGGMGEVLEAYDPELERPVAVKLLLSTLQLEHRERLRREAKALAKLSHPNVVHVYEVGSHEDQLFIAMEYVPGCTLRQWLRAEERSPHDVLRMFVGAGRGLAEAHANQLVHRDFKPDNVLVGADERPRIVDFGLARQHVGDESATGRPLVDELCELTRSHEVGLETSLTSTGAILGTPAYMSPEQFLGLPATAASDQFSFCVALWEALYGARPFTQARLLDLARAVCKEDPELPRVVRGPAKLLDVLRRGLSKKPDQRWPSMEALLGALGNEPPRRRWQLWGGVAAFAATIGVAVAAPWRHDDGPVVAIPAPPPGCEPVSTQFEGVWDEATRSALEARYTATDGPGARWWAHEKEVLDDWVSDWSRIYEARCVDEVERDPHRATLRRTCLDQRMIEIRARVGLLQALEPDVRAAAATNDYPPFALPSECEDDDVLLALTLYPAESDRRARIIETLTELRIAEGRASAAMLIGDLDLVAAEREGFLRAKAAVEATEFGPAVAEARLRTGVAWLLVGGKPELGFPLLEQAVAIADEARADALSVYAGTRMLEFADDNGETVYGTEATQRKTEAWGRQLARAGEPIHAMVRFGLHRARHRSAKGDREGMLADVEAVLARNKEAYGGAYFEKTALTGAADVLEEAGEHARAREVQREYTALVERLFGPSSIHMARALRTEVEASIRAGEAESATAAARRMVSIATRQTSEHSGLFVEGHVALARSLMALGDGDGAGASLRALDGIAADVVGAQSDIWALTQLMHMCLWGEVTDAARIAATAPDTYPAVRQLADILAPRLAGESDAEAQRVLAAALAGPDLFPLVRGAALIQWGRLLEAAGSRRAAHGAYASALDIDWPAYGLKFSSYEEIVETAARSRLAALETPAE